MTDDIRHQLKAWLNRLEATPVQNATSRFVFCRSLAHKMGLGHRRYQLVTIGGTNGKGSTAAVIESILLTQGYRVGVFSSPHLFEFNERIRLNGVPVDDSTLLDAFKNVATYAGADDLGYFACAFFAAMLIFHNTPLDVVILEVGIGGRLDTTNVMDPDLTIITNVGYDHFDRLGNDREVIARQKAGIMRPAVPLIYGGDKLPLTVTARANELKSPVYHMGRDFKVDQYQTNWDYTDDELSFNELVLPHMPVANFACAIKALTLLCPQMNTTKRQLQHVARGLNLPGRLQYYEGPPCHLFDVAHNPDAARYLSEHLLHVRQRVVAVAAMQGHKLLQATLAPLLAYVDKWHLAELNDTTQTRFVLSNILADQGVANQIVHADLASAYYQALNQTAKNDMLLVFGSFHTVAYVWHHCLRW